MSSFSSSVEMLVRVPVDHLTGRQIWPLFSFITLISSFVILQVEALHDFEAANSDELTLQRGDVVLVVPSDSEADQVKDEIGKCYRLHLVSLRVSWAQWLPKDISFSEMLQGSSDTALRTYDHSTLHILGLGCNYIVCESPVRRKCRHWPCALQVPLHR